MAIAPDELEPAQIRARAKAESIAKAQEVADAAAKAAASAQTKTTTQSVARYSPGDWRKAEEKSNESYYAEQNNKSTFTTSIIEPPVITKPPQKDTPTPTPTPATPSTVTPIVQAPPAPPVKTAPIDTVLFNDDEVPIEVMSDLIFEDIGGHELINIARNDIINGQDISYQPIKNLTSLQQQYNPNNILSVQSTSDKYFSNFAIKLENKTPNVGNGPFGSNVYLDPLTGNMVVDAINLESDEQIEIEITLSGTIYEADLTGSES